MKKIFYTILFLALGALHLQAQQDAHYSQYMFNGLLINPAYAGSKEFASLTGIYRNQWTGFEGAPVTTTFGFHMPSRNLRNGFGLSLLTDKIGPIRNSGVNLCYAYRIPLSKNATLALGLQGSLENYSAKFSDLRLEDPTDFTFAGQDYNKLLPNAGTGLWFSTERFYAGVSVPRLIRSNLAPTGSSSTDTRRELHYFFTSGVIIPVGESIKLRPSLMVKLVSGTPGSADFNIAALMKDKLWLGFSYRTNDAIAFMAQWNVTSALRIGYSYDLTTSALNQVQSGSHEIMVGYDFSFTGEKIFSPRYF